MHDTHDQLDDELREQLEQLRRTDLPEASEQRLFERLRADGLLEGSRSTFVRRFGPLAAVAALLLVVAGIPWLWPAPADGRDRYLLLLLEQAEAPLPGGAALVREYGEWAADLAARGLLEAGEKLALEGATLAQGTTPVPLATSGETVTGFFIVRAASADEALALANDCPHVRHGGRVQVRRIEPT